uniref:Intraflagellar transport protein 57-like protein n=1 Tax=Setaria digitata TaxID=48799 RepID=A0A915PSV5_9BILA
MEQNKEKDEKRDEEDEEDGNFAAQYDLCIVNDELNDKLKLLNYEEDYANLAPSYRVISREYFVESRNIGEQFFIFTTLSAWLIKKAIDPTFAFPEECDDPNGTVANIVDALRRKHVPVTFAASKLKAGAGEQCLYVLDKLADLALSASHFSWVKANPLAEDDEEVDAAVDQTEITAEEVRNQFDENEQVDVADDDDNETVMDLKTVPSSGIIDSKIVNTKFQPLPLDAILYSDTDANSWKLEVERVAPHLKVTFEQDSKDWRMHLEQLQSLQKEISDLVLSTEPHLKGICYELDKTMERIVTREKHLNSQLEPVLMKFRRTKDDFSELKKKYNSYLKLNLDFNEKLIFFDREINGGISERTQKLQDVSDDLEQIKQQIDEKSLRNSDGAPVLKLKQALQKLESEVMTMNVQISIIEQSLLQIQLKNRTAYNVYFQDTHI